MAKRTLSGKTSAKRGRPSTLSTFKVIPGMASGPESTIKLSKETEALLEAIASSEGGNFSDAIFAAAHFAMMKSLKMPPVRAQEKVEKKVSIQAPLREFLESSAKAAGTDLDGYLTFICETSKPAINKPREVQPEAKQKTEKSRRSNSQAGQLEAVAAAASA